MSADCRTKQNLNKKKISPVTSHLSPKYHSMQLQVKHHDISFMFKGICYKYVVPCKINLSQFLVFHHIGHTYVVPCPYQDQKDRP